MSEQLDDQLIYGIRPIEEALESEVVLDRIFISQESRNPALMAIAAKARKKGIFVNAKMQGSNYDYLDILHFAARWAELEIRSKNQK